ncbi:MAG: FMN-binding glutamate synthase family protein [Sulfobacillus benefaciens]|uniref:FMN-binding glutamate synthase family protein n=1 Tax=Sulfobacillus benefaciens TaxID=453960 RepID=A0A2T2XC54_9FIRM|nr:MAG: FMN-binding glutamate synthase family protein [Sulfobacillus benefaciens]
MIGTGIAAVWVIAGNLLIFVAVGVVLLIVLRRMAMRLERGLGQNPTGTLWEMLYTVNANSGTQLAMTMQRAEQGKPAEHPMGSSPAVFWLDQIGFDPATLDPVPRDRSVAVDLGVRLGPQAQKPLKLSLPVLIAPMGYGVGLNERAKVALAQASSLVDTAIASGEGPFLPEERAFATHWILQWSRAEWAHQAAVVQLADMVEIQVGQGSEAGIGIVKDACAIPHRAADAAHGNVEIRAITPGQIPKWIQEIRGIKGDVPIGIKVPANQHLEQDLALLTKWGVDVITLDGSAAGSAGSPAVISDHFGLDVGLAIHRAHRWLVEAGLRDQVSLIGSGGIHDAADIAKLLALGADAVAVGSTLLFALSHEQVAENLPNMPPTTLVMAEGQDRGPLKLDLDRASEHVAGWFEATRIELALICQALGVTSIHDLGPQHLIARSLEASARFHLASDADPLRWMRVNEALNQLVGQYQAANAILAHLADKLWVAD